MSKSVGAWIVTLRARAGIGEGGPWVRVLGEDSVFPLDGVCPVHERYHANAVLFEFMFRSNFSARVNLWLNRITESELSRTT